MSDLPVHAEWAEKVPRCIHAEAASHLHRSTAELELEQLVPGAICEHLKDAKLDASDRVVDVSGPGVVPTHLLLSVGLGPAKSEQRVFIAANKEAELICLQCQRVPGSSCKHLTDLIAFRDMADKNDEAELSPAERIVCDVLTDYTLKRPHGYVPADVSATLPRSKRFDPGVVSPGVHSRHERVGVCHACDCSDTVIAVCLRTAFHVTLTKVVHICLLAAPPGRQCPTP